MKYCTHCGKELMDDAVVCIGCGCAVKEELQIKRDYKTILRNTKVFLVIGFVLLALGIFAWVKSRLLYSFYSYIGEYIHDIVSTGFPSLSQYHTWTMMALYSSVVLFFAAVIMFLIPKNKFIMAFKRENQQLFSNYGKKEYKKAAKEKNKEMNRVIPGYRVCWIMAIVSCVLFVCSVVMPGLFFQL